MGAKILRTIIAIVCLSAIHVFGAGVPKFENNFATTNLPAPLTNIIKSLVTNTVAANQVWTNSSGVIQPSGIGRNTNAVSISSEGAIGVGRDLANTWGAVSIETIVGYHTISAGESPFNSFAVGTVDSGSYNYFSEIVGSIFANDTAPYSRVTLKTASTNINTQARVWTGDFLQLGLLYDNNPVTTLNPLASSITTPYVFDAPISHSSGNLFEIKNNGTNKFVVGWDGAVTATGVFTGNGAGLTNLSQSGLPAGVTTNNGTLSTSVLVGNGARGATNTGVGAVPINGNGAATTGAQILSVASNIATNNGNNQFSSIQTINGAYLRVTNTAAANSYTDVGAGGAITNVSPNGEGMIWLTNAIGAGNYSYMRAPSNGVNIKVLSIVTNSVEKFYIDSTGTVSNALNSVVANNSIVANNVQCAAAVWGLAFRGVGGSGSFTIGGSAPAITVQATNFNVSGQVTATNWFALPTNYVAANFIPVAGQVKIASSNGALFSVTQLSTNLIAGP